MSHLLFRIRRDWFLITVSLFLCAIYFFTFVDRAKVEVEIDVEHRSWFRIYWAEENDGFSRPNHARALIYPGRHTYRFHLTNIGDIAKLRIDPFEYPGNGTIFNLSLSQRGWQKIVLVGDRQSDLEPIHQIDSASFDQKGLVIQSTGADPQFLTIPDLVQTNPLWPAAELSRMLVMFFLLYAGGKLTGRLFKNKRYIPVCLVFSVGLILVMALISKYGVHPDEHVHVNAAAYYIDNWLPPEVDSEEIRHTYSLYGFSRLNSREVYYLFAGKFGNLIQAFELPDYLSFRLFNVLLFTIVVFLGFGIYSMRMSSAVLLISPQLWYVFGYCNSDALALFISLICGWQSVTVDSAFNRYLFDRERENVLTPLFTAAIMVGILLLIKKNFYPLILFLLVPIVLRALMNRDEEQADIRTVLFRLLLVCLIGLSLPALRIASDYYQNGPTRDQKIAELAEQTANPLFSPATEMHKRHLYLNMKERGVTLTEIIKQDRWFEKSFRSGFGVYGYMTYAATYVFYDLVRFLSITLLMLVAVSVLIWGNWQQRLLMISALVLSAALVAASLHHSWTADFQAQGRYLIPVPVMIGLAAAGAEDKIPRHLFCLLVLSLFSASVYSFIAIGLMGIPKAI